MAVTETLTKPGASRAELYKYQSWIHVGPGAEDCEDVHEGDGLCDCQHPLHFHAWVRLPNPFQHREIREKGLAAKARRIRLLSDSSSDLSAIMEMDLEALARRGEAVRADMTEEIIKPHWWRNLLDAYSNVQAQTVKGKGDGAAALKWEHIDDDKLTLAQMRDRPDSERSDDEEAELEKRIAAYQVAVEKEVKALEAPLRDELAELDISALLDRLRDVRLEVEGTDAFDHVYAEQTWLTCTYRQVDGLESFISLDDLHRQPDGVLQALKDTFGDLDREKAGYTQRNS